MFVIPVVPKGSQGRRTLCRVQRTVLPLWGSRGFSRPGIRCEVPGKGKSYRSLRRTSRAALRPRCARGGPGARLPQASSDPGAQRSRGVGVRVGGRCQGWGAAPLPSPPGGGRAGWGARARRTGSSCGPWGPWRAGRAPWGLGLRSRLRSPALLRRRGGSGLSAAERRWRAVHAQIKIPRRRGEGARGWGAAAGSRLWGPWAPRSPGARTSGSRVWTLSLLPSLSLCLSNLPRSPLLALRESPSVSASLLLSGSRPPAPASGSPARPLGLGLAPGLSVGGRGRPRPMGAEERALPAGRRAGVRAGTGSGRGPPADSPELEAALLMGSSREDTGGRPRGEGRGAAGPGDSDFNPFVV